MNEEIEYAEMLEIPVSTVNVVRKKQRRKRSEDASRTNPSEDAASIPSNPLKDSVIAQVNDRLTVEQTSENAEPLSVEPALFAESVNSEGRLDFDPIPERIDTVRLYSTDEVSGLWGDRLRAQNYRLNEENEGGRYETNDHSRLGKILRVALNAEFAAACILCGAIFLTNVFMPQSAINTFFRAIGSTPTVTDTDARTYTDFTLAPVISELSNAELSLSPAGILSFTGECCVYPAANGTVAEVTKNTDGFYTVKLEHSDSFTGIISGLDHVYYAVGEEVKANVPVGYTNGNEEVQVTMYSSGTLLNCFQLTEENCLAWLEEPTV